MEAFFSTVDRVNEKIGLVVSFFLLPIAIVTLTEVIARYVFNRPTIWAWDVNLQLFGFVILLGGGFALLRKRHVGIEAITEHLSPRGKLSFEIVGLLLIMFVAVILLWQGVIEAAGSVADREKLDTIWAPYIFHVKVLLPIGGALLLFQAFAQFLRNCTRLVKGGN